MVGCIRERLGTLRLGIGMLLAFCASLPAQAQTVEEFYRGKTITIVVGFPPGGGYDSYARLIGRFMPQHIPGAPSLVVRSMPGGGSRTAAGYVFNVAPRDGTVLGTADQAFPLQQALGDPTILVDNSKFIWIGNPVTDNNMVVTWHTSSVKTIEDAKRIPTAMGSTGSTTNTLYLEILNKIAGTKFKIVTGYPGTNEIQLALERGELDGHAAASLASLRTTKPTWIKDKLLNILVQIGVEKKPELGDAPLFADFARDDLDRAALLAISTPPALGRPFFATPDVPPDRVQALRAAFDATMKDPEFLDQVRAQGLVIEPMSGATLQGHITKLLSMDKATADRIKYLSGSGG